MLADMVVAVVVAEQMQQLIAQFPLGMVLLEYTGAEGAQEVQPLEPFFRPDAKGPLVQSASSGRAQHVRSHQLARVICNA
jgi:hypothetical protein